MTQQAFADRLGKSKSWVDKVERGVRRLDRYSVIRDIAEVLRLDPEMLLGPRQPAAVTPTQNGIDTVRAALARYHRPRCTVTAQQAGDQVAYAWMAYQHAATRNCSVPCPTCWTPPAAPQPCSPPPTGSPQTC
ncbi:helix-turn-helix domain-containing protein [Micromonospora sp. NPDC048871]|uniref:helix-turn-helix domain-containing protein n=1 Tax=Micromonospora sp. NPDC048871 TaxID=3364259 RepID=UPI003718BC25